MKRISFNYNEQTDLKEALLGRPEKIFVSHIGNHIPNSITLWKGQKGIRIYSTIYEFSDRIEVGYLNFKETYETMHDDVLIDNKIPEEHLININKLLIEVDHCVIECGIELCFKHPLYILSGAMPFSLAVNFIEKDGYLFDPAYDMNEYTRESL